MNIHTVPILNECLALDIRKIAADDTRSGTTRYILPTRNREEQRGLRLRALDDLIPYVPYQPADAGKCSTETIPRNSQPAVRGRERRIAAKRIVVRITTDSIRGGAGQEKDTEEEAKDEMRIVWKKMRNGANGREEAAKEADV